MKSLSSLEKRKLQFYKDSYGDMSAEQALAFALEAEVMCKSVGAFDTAFVHFKKSQIFYETYAELLEKE